MRILLDTCGLLALLNGGQELSEPARMRLEEPGSEVWVSAISAFEIGQKCVGGKMTLPLPAEVWFQAMMTQHQVREIPVTAIIGMRASALPNLHRDPFDRLIIATALEHGLEILTCDRVIPRYPGIVTFW